jgi:microcystin-dependent protein
MFHLYLSKDTKEHMADLSSDITQAVKRVYLADVQAIRNLSEVATKLQRDNNLTLPGNLTVTGSFNYLPRGCILAYNSSSAPAGWAICDGNNGTPDLRNKFILGSGNRSIGTTGGVETVTLTLEQMPKHSHSGTTNKNGKKTLEAGGQGGWNAGYFHKIAHGGNPHGNIDTANDHSHTFTTDNKGGNQAHENMPPFYVLTYIMKL